MEPNDIERLRALLVLLRISFRGSSFGRLKIDDAADSLQRAIAKLTADNKGTPQ